MLKVEIISNCIEVCCRICDKFMESQDNRIVIDDNSKRMICRFCMKQLLVFMQDNQTKILSM